MMGCPAGVSCEHKSNALRSPCGLLALRIQFAQLLSSSQISSCAGNWGIWTESINRSQYEVYTL